MLDQSLTVEQINPWFAEHSGVVKGSSLLSVISEEYRDEVEIWLHRYTAGDVGIKESVTAKVGEGYFVLKAAKCDLSGMCIRVLCAAESADNFAYFSKKEKLTKRRCDAISELTDKILFIYDTESGSIKTYGALSARIGGKVEAEKYPSVLCGLGLISDEGRDKLSDFLGNTEEQLSSEIKLDFKFDLENFIPAQLTARALKDEYGNICEMICVIGPEAENTSSYDGLYKRAGRTDALTGVFTREYFKELVAGSIAVASDEKHALIMLELDGCKKLNESRGHIFGDMVLKEISGVIGEKLGEQDILGRYAGAVFCIFCRGISSEQYAVALADEIKHTVDDNYTVRRAGFEVRCNYGIAIYGNDGDTAEELLRRADIAMYKSKSDRSKPIKFM